MTPSEGEGPVTSSYTGSSCTFCMIPLPVFDSMEAAVIFALLLAMETVTVTSIKTQTVKIATKETIDIIYIVVFGSILCMPVVFVVSKLWLLRFCVRYGMSVGILMGYKMILIGLLIFPARIPQVTVCTANMHVPPLVGTSVQVTLV